MRSAYVRIKIHIIYPGMVRYPDTMVDAHCCVRDTSGPEPYRRISYPHSYSYCVRNGTYTDSDLFDLVPVSGKVASHTLHHREEVDNETAPDECLSFSRVYQVSQLTTYSRKWLTTVRDEYSRTNPKPTN